MSANSISTLPTKQQRQIAKLELAQQKRAGKDRYVSRNKYDLQRLPSTYVGNISVPNQLYDVLLPSRPWVSAELVVNAEFGFAFDNSFGGYSLTQPTLSLTVAPSISGEAARGETLTLDQGTWVGARSITSQLYHGTTPMESADGATYVLPTDASLDNELVRLRVDATDAAGETTTAYSPLFGPILGAPLALSGSTVSGTAQVGQVVTASDPTYQGITPITLSYQWKADGENILGADAASFTITEAEYGAVLTRMTTGTNTYGSDVVTSDATDAVLPLAPTASLGLTDQTYTQGTGAQTYDVSGDFTGQGLVYSLVVTPSGVTIASDTGIVTTNTDVTALLTAASVVVRATNEAGSVDSGFSITTQDVPDQMDAPTLAVDSGTITVTLASDPAANNSAITSRDVRYSKDEATWTTVTGVTSPHDLTGLDAETLYYVQARAVNVVGAGDWSISAEATTGATGPVAMQATGGVEEYIDNGDGTYSKIHTFTSSGDLVVTRSGAFERWLLAGPGASGTYTTVSRSSSGAGAGQLVQTPAGTLTTGTHPVVIGQGGAAVTTGREGYPGGTSSFNGVTAIGGGPGGNWIYNINGSAGACGGGASVYPGSLPGAGLVHFDGGQAGSGSAYGRAGGGGGAGGPGYAHEDPLYPGFGGPGVESDITGEVVEYCRGGDQQDRGATVAKPPPVPGSGSASHAEVFTAAAQSYPGDDGAFIIRYSITQAEYEAAA